MVRRVSLLPSFYHISLCRSTMESGACMECWCACAYARHTPHAVRHTATGRFASITHCLYTSRHIRLLACFQLALEAALVAVCEKGLLRTGLSDGLRRSQRACSAFSERKRGIAVWRVFQLPGQLLRLVMGAWSVSTVARDRGAAGALLTLCAPRATRHTSIDNRGWGCWFARVSVPVIGQAASAATPYVASGDGWPPPAA